MVDIESLIQLTEKEWQSQVQEVCGLHGWLMYHTYNSRRSVAGFPDLVLVRPPRVIFAELKVKKGKLSNPQKFWQKELIECPGIEYYVWRPSDLDSIEEVLS